MCRLFHFKLALNHAKQHQPVERFFSLSAASGSQDFEEVAGGICLQVYRETLRGVVTACRRYKDELLEACLQLVLSAPTPVMTIQVKPKTLSLKPSSCNSSKCHDHTCKAQNPEPETLIL